MNIPRPRTRFPVGAASVALGLLSIGAAEPGERPRLAIIDLEAGGVPAELSRAITEVVANRTDRTGVFETVSPMQLSAVIALDKARFATGGCAEEDCFARLARAVDARHAIGGRVARAGDRLLVQLVLVDVQSAGALRREERSAGDASGLLDAAGEATVALLQPLLSERSGFLRVDANVPGAQITLNGERLAQRAGQVFPVAAGPHVVKASLDGFYPTAVDVSVRPEQVTGVQLTLVPAPETVKAYQSQANLLRSSAWITGGLAVAAGVASGLFYDQASQNREAVDSYNQLTDIERAGRAAPVGDRNDFDTNQGLYLSLLGTAVVSGLVSAGLFLFGPDPSRFDEFGDLSAQGSNIRATAAPPLR